MCVIVDANCASDLVAKDKPYIRLFWDWINSGGRIVSGGDLERELFKLTEMRNILVELSRSGQLRQIAKDRVEARAELVSKSCQSNDSHVVALAIEAKIEVVMTNDKALIADLKNRRLMGHRCRILKENSANPSKVVHVPPLLREASCR